LGKEPVDEAEVAPGDPRGGGDSLGVGEVLRVQGLAELAPPALQDEMEFFLAEWAVFVGKADPAVDQPCSAATVLALRVMEVVEGRGTIRARPSMRVTSSAGARCPRAGGAFGWRPAAPSRL
jgi:hypothetical protein